MTSTRFPAHEHTADDRTSLVFAGAQLWNSNGSPSLSAGGTSGRRSLLWLLDATTEEGVGNNILLPPSWTKLHADLYWTDATGGGGNVVWRLDRTAYGAGDQYDQAETVGSNVTATAGATGIIVVTRIATQITVDPTKLWRYEIQRTAANAADTLANDAAILAVVFTKAN